MQRTFISIGGGEIKNKSTLQIDEYIANLAKARSGDKRANALFIGTASHDSMPYFNSFKKTYTGQFNLKVDVALSVYGEMNLEKITTKFELADMIYIGGGNTQFMLNKWNEFGMLKLILDAYNRGVIIAGLSAGGIFLFEKMYSDSYSENQYDYTIQEGLGIIKGCISPHYNNRFADFKLALEQNKINTAYALEDNSAIVFKNEELFGSLSSGGNAYTLEFNKENIVNLV